MMTTRVVLITVWMATIVALGAQDVSRQTAPRISPLPEAEWTAETRTLFTRVGWGGPAPNDFKTFARHPELFKNVVPFAVYVSRDSGLEPRHRELLALRTAWLCRASYLWAQHAAAARREGFSAADLHRVAEGPDAEGWDRFEAALLRAADELHVNSFLTDEAWNALAARYDRARLLDALFTVAEYTMLAGVTNSLGVQPDEGLTERLPSDVAHRPAAARLSEQQIRLPQRRMPALQASDLTPEARAVLDPSGSGRLGGTAATYGYNVALYQPRQLLSDYVRANSYLAASAPVVHETLILRTVLHNRSALEWAAHQRFGREKGMTDEQIRGILAGSGAPIWNEIEAALLRAADEMQRDVRIGVATWNTLTKRFDVPQLMDIALTASGYRFITMGQIAMGLQADQLPIIPPVWPEVGAPDAATLRGDKARGETK
jgi:alkylhydroperoxidase family enzyme